MYTAKIGDKKYEIEWKNALSGVLGTEDFIIDSVRTGEQSFHIIRNNKSFRVDIVEVIWEDKLVNLKVNGTTYSVKITDPFDALLKEMGLENMGAKKVNNLKAPMPGLVLETKVEEGQEVKKGDALIVLEAMKMENVLKSPTDGVIKKIAIENGNTVEKNQLLIEFV